jgi:hypothetical protein
MDKTLVFGGIAAFLMFIGLAVVSWFLQGCSAASLAMNYLILLFGSLLGWAVGMLISPLGKKESDSFTGFGKAITTFLSGYLVSKLDLALNPVLSSPLDPVLVARFLIFGAAFLLGAIVAYDVRQYLTGE